MKKQKTTDKSKKATDVEARIRAVATEMSAITEFAEGSIKKAYSTYAVKGGGRRRSKTPQYKFQTRGGRGQQKVRHIPDGHSPGSGSYLRAESATGNLRPSTRA